jgi:hypothetical protein
MPVAVTDGSRWCHEAGVGYAFCNASTAGCGTEQLDEGLQ